MKKVLVLLTACALASSISSSYALTKKKKIKNPNNTAQEQGHINKPSPQEVQITQVNEFAVPAPEPKEEKKNYPAWIDNFSGNLAFTSNYIFRGVSQTMNLPAVQGGITYAFPIGLYLNAWGSNVKFSGTDATVEIDTIVGWRGEVGENFAYDLNYDRYNYPGARQLNYNEFNSVFNYYFLQAGLSYSGNAYATHKPGTYYNGGINYELPPIERYPILDQVKLFALMGHYSLPRAAGNSYNDYNVGMSKKIKIYTLMAQWTNTNGRQHNSPYDSSHWVGTLLADF